MLGVEVNLDAWIFGAVRSDNGSHNNSIQSSLAMNRGDDNNTYNEQRAETNKDNFSSRARLGSLLAQERARTCELIISALTLQRRAGETSGKQKPFGPLGKCILPRLRRPGESWSFSQRARKLCARSMSGRYRVTMHTLLGIFGAVSAKIRASPFLEDRPSEVMEEGGGGLFFTHLNFQLSVPLFFYFIPPAKRGARDELFNYEISRVCVRGATMTNERRRDLKVFLIISQSDKRCAAAAAGGRRSTF